MKKARSCLFFALACLFVSTAFALEPRDYAVDVTCQAQLSPPALVLSWPAVDFARQYWVRRKGVGDATWSNPIASLPGNSSGFTDTQVSIGSAWEYEIQMETTAPAYEGGFVNAYTYIYGGLQAPLEDFKGKAVLIVDNSIAAPLANELSAFAKDLIQSGYTVIQRNVDRTASVNDVKSVIRGEYNADPGNLRSVILIGHVPVPYSGNIAPDLHESHKGAWPADVFYADMNGTWTDDTVSITSEDYPENDNFPGDGKFDQSQIPARIQLELGRIDFANMPSFAPRSEVDLLRTYFQKDHAFRTRIFTAPRRGLIHDNFGDLEGDAPAVDAWRHYSGFFGAGHTVEVGPDAFFPTLNSESFLWAYGCGGGGDTKADGVGSTADFAAGDPKAVFFILHGSYFGDWNRTDNFLRAALGSPSMSLESIWSGIPHWYMHHMGLGASIGFSTRVSQNNVGTYKSYRNFDAGEVHIALLGDPTLNMYPVAPIGNLTANAGSEVSLSWNPSPDENIVGYHVYYSGNATGPFTRVTATPISATSFTHNGLPAGRYYYMVRAVKLEQTGSGSFFNASQGVSTSVTKDSDSGGDTPTVSIAVLDGDAGESGGNPGSFKITRSTAGTNPLTVTLLIGGTAGNGVDYATIPQNVAIPGGSSSSVVSVAPIADDAIEGDETVTIQLGTSPNYNLGSAQSALLTIKDDLQNRAPVISPISSQTISQGSSTGDIPFTVTDAESNSSDLTVRATSSDTELVPLSAISVSGTGVNRAIRITPAPGRSGNATIQVIVSDGTSETSTSFILTVGAVNQPPTASDINMPTLEETARLIQLSGRDPEGAPLSFAIKTQPTLGVLTGTPPDVVYTPNVDANGTDSFTFSVSDGRLESIPATVTIEILPVNDLPVAVEQSVRTAAGSPLPITLEAHDIDNPQLAYRITTNPSQGTLTGNGSTLLYTPNSGASGSDFFVFVANDGSSDSNPATVSITILPGNSPPIARDLTIPSFEDGATAITLRADDSGATPLTYSIISQPLHGKLTGTAPNVFYTPNLNYNGADQFQFKASDGQLESGAGTVTINVQAVNDPPKLGGIPNQIFQKNGSSRPVSISVEDVDSSELSLTASSSDQSVIPAHALVFSGTGAAQTLLLTPARNSTGLAAITVRVSDGSAFSETTFQVTVTNTPPAAADDDIYSAVPDIHIPFTTFLANDMDPDGDPLVPALVSTTSTAGGTIQNGAGEFIYSAPRGKIGEDNFSYTVQDTSGAISTAVIRIHASTLPKITGVQIGADATVLLSIRGTAFGHFRVQSSTDAKSWKLVGEGTANSAGAAEFRDRENGSQVKLYRVEWL